MTDPLIESWNQLNSLLGKTVYTASKLDWQKPKVFNRYVNKNYILTPDEVISLGVTRNGGGSRENFNPDPRNLNPTQVANPYQYPSYWFVNSPFWVRGDRITLIERVTLRRSKSTPQSYVHQIGKSNKLSVLFYDTRIHPIIGETCANIEPLLERLSQVGIKTLTTSLTS
jgi:hypothetical protein